jgi:hypothetical protein
VRHRDPFFGPIALASLAAGPIFVASTGLAVIYLQLPDAMVLDPAQIPLIILLFIPAIAIGFVLSIAPNLIGSLLMLSAGGAFSAARGRPTWIGAGALVGAAIAGSFGAFAEPAYAFGLIFTSACCAAICRLSAHWD